MSEPDDEFWNTVGNQLEFKTLLHDTLRLCEKNSVKLGADVVHVEIHRACPFLKIKQNDESDPSKAQIYCEECGIICPVIVPSHEKLFGVKSAAAETQADELDEFLERAGAYVDSDDDEFYSDSRDSDDDDIDIESDSAEEDDAD